MGKMSHGEVVIRVQRHIGKVSYGESVIWGKCHMGKCHMGKRHMGNVS